MRRVAVVWVVLFAAYAATLGVHASGASLYAGDELSHLLIAESIVSDGDADLADEYAAGDYADFHPYALEAPEAALGDPVVAPLAVGFGLVIAPAYALGGALAVQILLAALAALAFALAVPLARRVAPEPWATRSVVVLGLSPPALGYGATVHPELVAGGVLVAATLLALRVRDTTRARNAYASAALLGLLPWLGTRFVVPGAVVLLLLLRWSARRGRGLAALFCAEIVATSLVVFGSVNSALYGGLTPLAASAPGDGLDDVAIPSGFLERLPRLAGLAIDRDYGVLRWAPFAALALVGAFALWRSLRERISRALPERRDVEAAALACAGIAAATALAATLTTPHMTGDFFAPRHLVAALPAGAALCAWGWQRAPRAGGALAVLTLAGSAWLAIDLFGASWVRPDSRAPLGPLLDALPRIDAGTGEVAAALALGALALVVALEWWRWSRVKKSAEDPTIHT